METQVRTPQLVFMQPQRLTVPLFQRPYVWNEENQWEPLWNDVVRVANRLLENPAKRQQPHFLGAVVLQQAPGATGRMQERTIIDGQQRLTTIQLLLDALHAELLQIGAVAPAMRLEPLITNAEPFCAKPEDRFKVWPTNRDRPAFNAVMSAPPPVDHDSLEHHGERMVEAHRFFSECAREWLRSSGSDDQHRRAEAIETAVRDQLQMVVIDLAAEENAQEIFETLNARGAQLTAADLIKNLIFQRLSEAGALVEQAYERFWKEFETGFWEAEINLGRTKYPRSSVFLNHWLIARTGGEVVAREVFTKFKTFADYDSGLPMQTLLEHVHRAAGVYKRISSTSSGDGQHDRLPLFVYRTGVLESEVVKPLLLFLLDPEQPPIVPAQLTKALAVVESWMVRRMLVRATTKSYTQVVGEVIQLLRGSTRPNAGDAIEAHLKAQDASSRYWPDDNEIRAELRDLQAYRRIGRSRLRMVLEALEDHARGWCDGKVGLGEERVARGKYAIEHVMPRKWTSHWPLASGRVGEAEREQLIHTIGNLTLLTGKLNSRMSNGPWRGPGGKREALEQHSVLMLNRELLRHPGDTWSDDAIAKRSDELAGRIIEIWPAPLGHRSSFSEQKPRRHHRVDLADLINAGLLQPGMTLHARRPKNSGRVATLLADGRVDVDGTAYPGPTEAATAIAGKRMGGWWFFLVDPAARRSLRNVRQDYVHGLADDADDESDEEGEDDDE